MYWLQPLEKRTVKLNWEANVNRNSKLRVLWHLEHEFILECNAGVSDLSAGEVLLLFTLKVEE